MKRITALWTAALTVLAAVMPFSNVRAQMATDSWRAHMSYHDATYCVKAWDRIYVLSAGSIYSYCPDDDALTAYDKIWPLSDTGISAMAWCSAEKAIVLAYSDGNIDLLYEDDDIYNITDLKNSYLKEKQTCSIYVEGNVAYLSTSSGLVLLDVTKKEIRNTYLTQYSHYSSAIRNGILYCSTAEGLFCGKLSDNLLDSSKWTQLKPYPFLEIVFFGEHCMLRSTDNTVYELGLDNLSMRLVDKHILHICNDRTHLTLIKADAASVYDSNLDFIEYQLNDYTLNYLMFNGSDVWACCGNDGLSLYRLSDGKITVRKTGLLPDSPRRNTFNTIKFTSSGYPIAVGGAQNYAGIVYEGTIMTYENGRWSYFDDDIPSKTGHKYIDLTTICEDPQDPEHFFAGSARQGMYEFKNRTFIKLHTWDNSALAPILDHHQYDFTSANGMQYDADGNLWVMNNEVDTIIRILKPDGKWTSLYYSEIKGLPTFTQTLFDSNGLMWTVSSRYKPGLFCLDTKGTLEDQSDDRHRFSGNSFTNQDGTTVTVNDIYFIAEDQKGIMWTGTDQGIFTIEKPASFLDVQNIVFNRIKIPRNDGSGQADYLLNGVYTTCIAIDEANRKWIGTLSDGIFLLSANGIETIHHFTADNSPLLSDYIHSIAVNNATGEVFIGTDNGLTVFGGDAATPAENLKKSNVTVYPNPILPEYEGNVTVKGLSNNCSVKVLTASGTLVYEGKSNGGTFVWNCRNLSGRKVSSGVYSILAVDSEGNRGIVSKVTVIR